VLLGLKLQKSLKTDYYRNNWFTLYTGIHNAIAFKAPFIIIHAHNYSILQKPIDFAIV